MKRAFTQREKKTTFKQRQEIVTLHLDKGISQGELAKKFGVSIVMIGKYCRASGRSNPRWKDWLDEKEIIQLNTEKQWSIQRIAKHFGVSQSTISKCLKRNGIFWKPSFRREHFIATVPDYRIKLRIWEYKVYEADGLKCRWCKTAWKKDNRLEAHHITPLRNIIDTSQIFSLDNGITLCRKCHMKVHYREKDFEDFFRGLIKSRGCL